MIDGDVQGLCPDCGNGVGVYAGPGVLMMRPHKKSVRTGPATFGKMPCDADPRRGYEALSEKAKGYRSGVLDAQSRLEEAVSREVGHRYDTVELKRKAGMI